MTTLAVPRSLRTSATSACHALVDATMDHRVTCLKIQGYLIWRELDPFTAANEADGPGEAATITNAFRWRENGLTQAEKLHPSRDNRG